MASDTGSDRPRSAGPSRASGDSKRLLLLDILRGVAALAVVVWHWQHFFYSSSEGRVVLPDLSVQPFYAAFWGLYELGDTAVDLFFTLSGFIFFRLYAEPVHRRRISARDFLVLRLSRLYPLHLATLLLVAALQMVYRHSYDAFFVYSTNDAYHFGLHLAFASHWGFEQDHSFNAPIWSVSIEILLYALFFLVCRQKWFRPTDVVIIAAFAALAGGTNLGRGLFSFYLGGGVFYLLNTVQAQRPGHQELVRRIAGWAAFASLAVLWSGVHLQLVLVASTSLSQIAGRSLQLEFPTWGYLRTVVFPALIIFLGLSEEKAAHWSPRLAWLGDITYSSYLLHFPLQLVVVLTIGSSLDFTSGVTMGGFLAALIAVSAASYHFFERPVQGWLRGRLRSRG